MAAWLLVARLVLRRDLPAWLALFLVTFAMQAWESVFRQPWSLGAPLALLVGVGAYAAIAVTVLAKEGLLAAAAFYAVGIAFWGTPITYDVTRWYAWRTGVVVVLVAGLVFWGFRNVLGRQTAFPAGALDQ